MKLVRSYATPRYTVHCMAVANVVWMCPRQQGLTKIDQDDTASSKRQEQRTGAWAAGWAWALARKCTEQVAAEYRLLAAVHVGICCALLGTPVSCGANATAGGHGNQCQHSCFCCVVRCCTYITTTPCTLSTLHPPKGLLLQEQGHWVPLLQAALQLPPPALGQQQMVKSGGGHAGMTCQAGVPAG